MDVLSRISSPEFKESVYEIIGNRDLQQNIDGVDYISRVNTRCQELIYKMIVDKMCQDIKQKNEIVRDNLVKNVVLAILVKHYSSKKDTTKIYNDLISALDIFVRSL